MAEDGKSVRWSPLTFRLVRFLELMRARSAPENSKLFVLRGLEAVFQFLIPWEREDWETGYCSNSDSFWSNRPTGKLYKIAFLSPRFLDHGPVLRQSSICSLLQPFS